MFLQFSLQIQSQNKLQCTAIWRGSPDPAWGRGTQPRFWCPSPGSDGQGAFQEISNSNVPQEHNAYVLPPTDQNFQQCNLTSYPKSLAHIKRNHCNICSFKTLKDARLIPGEVTHIRILRTRAKNIGWNKIQRNRIKYKLNKYTVL